MAAGIAACENSTPILTSNQGLLGSIAASGGSNGLVSVPVDALTAIYTVGLGAGFPARGAFEFSDADEAKRKKWEKECLEHYNKMKELIEHIEGDFQQQREDRLGLFKVRDLPSPQDEVKGFNWRNHVKELMEYGKALGKELGYWQNSKTGKDDKCPDPDGIEALAEGWADIGYAYMAPEGEDWLEEPFRALPQWSEPATMNELASACDATCQAIRILLLFGAAGGLAGGAILRAQ